MLCELLHVGYQKSSNAFIVQLETHESFVLIFLHAYFPREEILQAAKAVAQATEDLVQKAQGCDSLGEDSPDSPDSSHQLASLQTTSGREEVSMAARYAVTTLVSQARIVTTGAAVLTGDNVGKQVR